MANGVACLEHVHMRVCCPALGFFFFSSRRRHTRSDRDWSSDVCSSDLPAIAIPSSVCTWTAQLTSGRADKTPPCRVKPGRRSEEHTSELQSRSDLVCRLLLEKKKK